MSYAINADNIDAIEQSLEGGGPSARAPGLSAGTGAAGDLAGSSARLEAQVLGTTDALAFQTGTNGPDTLLGGDGTDLINARGGDDRASGGGGDDLVFGGNGNDYLTGDGALAGPVPPFPYPPAGDDTIVGGAGDDTLYGDGFVSYDHAGDKAGNNLLFGGSGNDAIIAGYGADTAFGGSGNDYIQGYGSSGPTPGANIGYRNMDRADLLFGEDGDDTIVGGGGNDTLDGGTGDDRLSGDVGVDALTGGPGADTFVFGLSGLAGTTPDTGRGEGNRDVVADFQSGVDVLDVTGYHSPSVTWAFDEAGDRTVVTIADFRSANYPNIGPYEIELAGVQSLAAGDILV